MKTVYVLSSTHWDREWYEPFELYRSRLVRMIDRLLEILERDSEYRCFHFDGQTILIEDYLEVRPQNAERLKKLIREGRILIGPWYTMPDEFLISGEALVQSPAGRGDLPGIWRLSEQKRLRMRHFRPQRPDAADLPRLWH